MSPTLRQALNPLDHQEVSKHDYLAVSEVQRPGHGLMRFLAQDLTRLNSKCQLLDSFENSGFLSSSLGLLAEFSSLQL